MSLDFCLETNMLKLSYKHLELSYYWYFHVFSIVKNHIMHIYSRYEWSKVSLTRQKEQKNTYFPIHYRLLNCDCY